MRAMEFGLFLVVIGLGYGAYEVNQWRTDRSEAIFAGIETAIFGLPIGLWIALCMVSAGVYLVRDAT